MTRAIKLVFQVLAALFGSLALVFAVAAWRLSEGPISLSFLSPYLAQAFEAEDLDYRLEFTDTILTWAGWDRSLDISVRGVTVKNADGAVLGTVPELSVGLSGRQLLRGRVSPTVIELLRPEVVLHRALDGSVSFGVGDAIGGGASNPAVEGLLAGVMTPRDPDRPLGLLRRVSVRDAVLTFEDESAGLIIYAQTTNIVFDRDPRGLVGHLNFVAKLGDLTLPISGDAVYDRASGVIDSQMRITGVNPADLAAMIPQLDTLKSFDLPLTGKVGVSLSAEGEIGKTTFDVASDRGQLTVPGVLPETLDVVTGRARGAISADRTQLQIDDLFLDFGGPSMNFAGLIDKTPGSSSFNGEFVLLNVPIDQLGRYWPQSIAADGRDWVLANASSGVMNRLTASVKLPEERLLPGGFNSIKPGEIMVDYEFADATINYLNGLPKVTGVEGAGHTDGLTMTVTMRDGMLGPVKAIQGRAEMRDLTADSPLMSVVAELDGEAQDVLEILDLPRLGYVSRVGLKPAQVTGHVRGQMGAQFPMLKRLKAEAINLSAKATVDGLAIEGVLGNFKTSDGAFDVSVDSASGLDVKGTMKIEEVPSDISWRENFSPDAPFLSRYEISATLDDAARQRLGVSLAPYLSGPVPTVFRYTDSDRKKRNATAVMDLKEATLALPELYWEKASGVEGNLALNLDLPKGGPGKISNFVLQAKDVRFEGNATLDDSLAGFKELYITRMLVGLTDTKAQFQPAPEGKGPAKISIKGESLDIRPHLGDLMHRSGEPVTNLELDIDVKRLITRVDQQLTEARVRMVFGDKGLTNAFLDGKLASGVPLRVRLEPDGANRRLVVDSDDAGSVARAFDIFDNATGGKLHLEARIADSLAGEPVEGLVEIEKYKVRKASTLANLLAFASLTGIGDVLSGEGLSFDHFTMPFTVFDNLVTIKDAKTSGSALGLTASGTVKLDSDETDIRGTIVPAYALNSLLSDIPLLGDILSGGEEGGGIFAATYTVQGPIETPTITVNPLAALAPGFFRNLFLIFDGPSTPTTNDNQSTEPPIETDR